MYRKNIIATTDYLIEVREKLFTYALNIAMNNELKEIDAVFEKGDEYVFQ